MKRILLAATVAATLFACNNGEQKETAALPKNSEWAWDNLKGKVKTLTEETYKTDSLTGAIGKKDSLYSEANYDEKGYVTDYIQKDSSGKKVVEQKLTRRKNGSVEESRNSKDGKPATRFVTEADSAGHYTSAKTFDSTGKQDGYYTELKTNEYGMVYAGKQYKMDGTLKSAFDSKYDKTLLLSQTTTDSTGKVVNTTTNKLNEKGDPSETTNVVVGKDSTTTTITTYKYDKYDETGNWTQRTSYEKGKPVAITKRTFTYYKD